MSFLFKDSVIKPMEKWFEQNEVFGLKLPDGWFGRPYDNHHRVTLLEDRKYKLLIEVDEQLFFLITKPIKLSHVEGDLVISDFKQVTFDRQGYGDMKPKCKVYDTGELTFVALKY